MLVNLIMFWVVEEIRDLGDLVDSKFHLDDHVNAIASDAFKIYGFVVRSST